MINMFWLFCRNRLNIDKLNYYNPNQNNNFPNFNFYNFFNTTPSVSQYSENLKLRYDKPEISCEENLPEDKLIELKQSPARQKLSTILHECDNKCFSVTDKDATLLNIIGGSGLLKRMDFEEQLNAILVSKTEKVISVIQGIDQLNTANMTESEMEAKANEFARIIEQEKSSMATFRQLLTEGAELAKEYSNNKGDKNTDKKIKAFEKKFGAFAQSITSDNTENTNKPVSKK